MKYMKISEEKLEYTVQVCFALVLIVLAVFMVAVGIVGTWALIKFVFMVLM